MKLESLGACKPKNSKWIELFSSRRTTHEPDGVEENSTSFNYDSPSLGVELPEASNATRMSSSRLLVVWLAMLGEVSCKKFVDAVTRDFVVARDDRARFGDEAIPPMAVSEVMGTPNTLRSLG